MTTLEDRPDIDLDELALAAEVVVSAGYGSQRLVQRKLRVGWEQAATLLAALEAGGIVGAPDDEGTWPVLVGADEAGVILAGLAEPPPLDLADEVGDLADEPGVDLVKHQPHPGDDDGEPGDELAIRPDDDLAIYQPGQVELYTATPRQQVARLWCRLIDEPAITRSVAVTRQAPKAGARLVIWTPRGAVRGLAMSREWLFATRSQAMVGRLADQDHPEWHKSAAELGKLQERLATRRWMVGVAAGVAALVGLAWWAPQVFAGLLAVVVAVAVVAVARPVCREPKELAMAAGVALALGWVTWRFGPDLAALIPRPPVWVWWILGGGLVVLFGLLGRKEDQKLVEKPPTSASTKPPTITAPMVIGALVALGNSKMKDPDSVRVLMDPHRTGPFVQIDLELPAGVTAAWVMENREELAAAMRRPMSMVWPRVGSAHPGHLVVLVSETPMNEMDQEPWPLLAAPGPIDIFMPQPVFTDQLGQWRYLTLAYASWVIGAVPRMGKTYTMRQLLLIFGMDPRVKVIALDGKGTGDLAPLTAFAHLHVRGARVDKPENIEQVRKLVRDLLTEMGRRADVLAGLPFDEVPDSKVTSELINAHPELDLAPIVLGIDETQSFFSYGFRSSKEHKEIREEIRDGIIELMRMGPALGIWVILATQTVRDSTIPTEAQAVAVYRYGLKMESHEPNDKVLGTGAHRAGITATIFGFEEKGIGWFKGEGAKPFIARSVVNLDAVAARAVAVRARAWRAARGLLTGEAGNDGIEDAEIVHSILEDTVRVMREHGNTSTAHLEELVAWLGELREDYADLDVPELGKRLRNARMVVSPVWRVDRTKQGVDLRKQPPVES